MSDIKKYERSTNSQIINFFDECADSYDLFLENPYWSFSNEVLKHILITFTIPQFKNKPTIKLFDAGGGTGIWSKFFLDLFSTLEATLFDINNKMLSKAWLKLRFYPKHRYKLIEGDLENPSDYPAEKSDLIICLHNVIGFSRNTQIVLRNLAAQLQAGGLAFIMTANKSHAYQFNIDGGNKFEAERVIFDGTTKFKENMPEIFCYTPEEFRYLLDRSGFKNIIILGFPITIKPSHADTQLGIKTTYDIRLIDKQKRQAALEMEKKFCLNQKYARFGRDGLIAIATK